MPAAKIIHTRDYGLFCQGQLADSYPVLRELRNTEPVHWCEPWDCWIVTSYDDVQQGHLYSRFSSGKARITMNALSGELRTRVDGLGKHLALWVSHTDPPGNKRLRESVQKPFVTRSVLAMQDRVTAIANELANELVDAVVVSG